MNGKIYITLGEHEFEALREQARRDLRGVREQATFHILRGLNIVNGTSEVIAREQREPKIQLA